MEAVSCRVKEKPLPAREPSSLPGPSRVVEVSSGEEIEAEPQVVMRSARERKVTTPPNKTGRPKSEKDPYDKVIKDNIFLSQ